MSNEELYHEQSMGEMLTRFPEMTKKEIIAQAEANAQQLLDEGQINEYDALAAAERLNLFSETFTKNLRNAISELPEKTYKRGNVEFSMRNTGERLDYDQDELYAQLKEQLKQREALLKLAYKQDETLYDSEGVEVPKVGVKTPSREVLTIKF